MTEEEQIFERLQYYALQIHNSALARRKPGASLANYMRTLDELDRFQAQEEKNDV